MSNSSPPIVTLGPALIAAGGLAAAFGGIGLGVMIAVRSPSPPPQAVPVVAETAPAPTPAPAGGAVEPAEEPEAFHLTVQRVSAIDSAVDPFAPIWMDAPAVDVPLEPQMITAPMLHDATVDSARLRAVSDGDRIAFLVSWEADQPATAADTGRFSDAAALQFPLVPGASYMMGGRDMPVHALYWRAQWQEDVDHGFQDVYSLYPNFWVCGYWFADAEGDAAFPPRVPAAFSDERSHQWFIAQQAGNPMADFHRTRPVDEMVAEGFGTLTHVPDGTADGRGVWRDGRWYVVFVRPIGDDALSDLFRPGQSSQIGVAVWDGDAGNVAGRKHYSFWVPYEVSQ